MMTKLTFISGLLALLFFAVNCDKPVDNDDPETSVPGNWRYAFPPIPGVTTDTLTIRLTVNSTTDDYTLELIERADKKLFSSTGIWTETDDSIFLTGTECTILDTTADPDTLAALDQATCETPIALQKPEKEELWTIQTQSVSPMLAAFPIPEAFASLIPQFFPEIPLKKVED